MTNNTQPPVHDWLKKIAIAYVPEHDSLLLEQFSAKLISRFHEHGHTVLSHPSDPPGSDVVLTSARFGEPVNWRDSLMLTARRRFKLDHAPTVITLVHARPDEWDSMMAHLEEALSKENPDPADFTFPGLTDRAYHTLIEQGKRGGAIMAMVRLVQSHSVSIRDIVVIGDSEPQYAYTFDLVGGHPRSDAAAGQAFYDDLMNRILTAACTSEMTDNQVSEEVIPLDVWHSLDTPRHMYKIGRKLGDLNFFTEMVKVSNLVDVPLLNSALADQYSEGCFATWEPVLDALVCTITGSARPVKKDDLTENELAVIAAVRPDERGVVVRHVEGKQNDPPSSEALEMVRIDQFLPKKQLGPEWPVQKEAPVSRSKLHGHRGVRAYDPEHVEFVYLDAPYYAYPVSCSTGEQANAIVKAFAQSEALLNPEDPRQVVFTILPGHGVMIVEKWVPGKAPLEAIYDCIADGRLEVEDEIPQGTLEYQSDGDNRCVLKLIS